MPAVWSPALAALLRTELRMLLRDRRTVVLSIVLPLAVMPIMLFAGRWSVERREKAIAKVEVAYAVVGAEGEQARGLVEAAVAGAGGHDEANGPTLRAREASPADPVAALHGREIQLVVEGRRAGQPSALPAAETTPDRDAAGEKGERPAAEGLVVTLAYRGDRDDSAAAARSLAELLKAERARRQGQLLQAGGLPVEPRHVLMVSETNLASAGQVAGLGLGRILTLMLLVFVLSGGAVVATDTLAGEKERGTLETLLTSAVSRHDVIVAKGLSILAVALVITLIQALNFLVYVGFGLIRTSPGLSAAVPPHVALLLLVLYVPVAALASGVLLLVSGRAGTYKEAQLYFFPVFLLGLVPALAPFLPGVSLRSAIVLVPVANVAVAVKEILTGTVSWPFVGLAWLVTAGAAWGVARTAEKTLTAERLVLPAAGEGADLRAGLALLERHVVRAFALMWALIFILSGQLPADVDLRLQLAANLLVVFLGGSLFLVRRYRLDWRQALAWRLPHPGVWPAVLLAAPACLLTGLGVFHLASLVLPVPPAMLRAFTELLLPDSLPRWQLLLMLTVLPGVCEEIAFRGVLLHGLHRRLHPVATALVVGVTFGLFHFSLFRLAPTAFLGVALAAVTMLTGSIFPAMLWHALNNLIGVGAALAGLPLEILDPWTYLAGAAALAVAMWVIWRLRTPYPGLRCPRGGR